MVVWGGNKMVVWVGNKIVVWGGNKMVVWDGNRKVLTAFCCLDCANEQNNCALGDI
jgi:hypothetical protein